MLNTDFIIIPVATKYEMNSKGVIRNIKTRKILKWRYRGTSKQVVLRNEQGKTVCFTYPSLMWLMFGKRITQTGAIPVVATRGHRQLYFPSCRSCAMELAKATNYAPSTFYNNMVMRKNHIGGWEFKYLD